jgi:putative membrane protein
MYSLFIGLTLGGVPVVWKMARPATPGVWAGAAAGFLVMAVIAYAQSGPAGGTDTSEGWILMFVAGLAGASAMILPGISGGYLLLVLGVYVPILSAISTVKDALRAGDLGALLAPGVGVVLPVGLGVLIGVLVVSNLLRLALERFERPTLGALLGFLVGAVVGLWPFQRGVAPEIGSTFKGQVVTTELLEQLEPHKYPTELFDPSLGQTAAALGLVLAGFGLTALIAYLGRTRPDRSGAGEPRTESR